MRAWALREKDATDLWYVLRQRLGSSGAFSQSHGIGLWERKRTLWSFLHPLRMGTRLSLRFSQCCTHAHTYLYTQTHTHTHVCTQRHTQRNVYTYTYAHIHYRGIHRDTYADTETHVHTNTYTLSFHLPTPFSSSLFIVLTFPQSSSTHSSRFLSFSIPLSIPTCRPDCK